MKGIDVEPLTAWLSSRVDGARPPFTFDLVAGGHSNLTYVVTGTDGRRFMLRRPPLGRLLPSAHDVGREHRILAALDGTPVPVPHPVAVCADESVTGAPFYVMEHVDGLVLRDAAAVEAAVPTASREKVGIALADTLAAIHAVDPADVGLADLGRPDGYLVRQLKRWRNQLERSTTRDQPVLFEMHEWLAARMPAQQGPARFVHGDYRLDNCLVGPDGEVRAVLDWELCTLGDPLADVGLLMVYWPEPGDATFPLGEQSPTTAGGFPTRAEMLDRYAAASGRDVSDVAYFVAFGYWRLACITEGVYARYKAGTMGDDSVDPEVFAERVNQLAAAARETAASA